jgi:integration host factor subunit alpha
MTTRKIDIIECAYDQLGIPRKDCFRIVDSLLDIIKEDLAKGKDVMISGFGKWTVKGKKKRKGRNPHTGEEPHAGLCQGRSGRQPDDPPAHQPVGVSDHGLTCLVACGGWTGQLFHGTADGEDETGGHPAAAVIYLVHKAVLI